MYLTHAGDPRTGVFLWEQILNTQYSASLHAHVSLPMGGVTIIMVSCGDTERTKFMSRTSLSGE